MKLEPSTEAPFVTKKLVHASISKIIVESKSVNKYFIFIILFIIFNFFIDSNSIEAELMHKLVSLS